MNIFINVLPF